MNLTNNEKVTLPSGAELEMTLVPFSEGRRLYVAVTKALKSINLTANLEDANALKDAFIEVSTSKEVEDAILTCLKRCTYNNERILSWDFFEDLNRREDYLPLCWEVAKFNLYPFMKQLFARLSDHFGKTGLSQKPK